MKRHNLESTSIKGLIPESLIDDANALIIFIAEYYNFLNQEGHGSSWVINELLNNQDVDHALDSFVELIKAESGTIIPDYAVADKRKFYKHINELYLSKGSIDSYKLLFRVLFDVEIEIGLPKENLLITSDGKWAQEKSLFVEVSYHDPFSIVGSIVSVISADGTSNIKLEVPRIKHVTDYLYEFSISNFIGTIYEGYKIYYNDIFIGSVKESLNAITINATGKNFKVGQLIDVSRISEEESTLNLNDSYSNQYDNNDLHTSVINNYVRAVDSGYIVLNNGVRQLFKETYISPLSKIKVNAVDYNGGITKISFLDFGTGYDENYSIQIIPLESDYKITYLAETYDNKIYELAKISDNGSIQLNSEVPILFGEEHVVDNNELSNIGIIKSNDKLVESINNPNRAIVTFTNNSVAKYQGSHISNDGFVSDSIRLQDNYYYQAYSYDIKSEIDISRYKNIISKILHPAGMVMFGQIILNNVIDATAIRELARYFNNKVNEIVSINDAKYFHFTKAPFVDEVLLNVPYSEFFRYHFNGMLIIPLADTINTVDSGIININPYAIEYFSEDYTDSYAATI